MLPLMTPLAVSTCTRITGSRKLCHFSKNLAYPATDKQILTLIKLHEMFESKHKVSDQGNSGRNISNVSKTYTKLKDEANYSTFSRISHDLSKINYLKTSSVFDEDFDYKSKSFETFISEDASHALYDRVTDKFYGVPAFNRDLHWTNVHLAGCWGCHAYEYSAWDDAERHVVKLKNFLDLELTEDENNGILTERIIAACSTYLDRSPETEEYVLCKCILNDKGFYEIAALKHYHYLQYLDLSRNRIQSLRALGELPFLMYLDASFNLLTEVLGFKAPFNLMFANFASNDIKYIKDLSDFWSLLVLDLSHNEIEAISGLENLKYLRGLNLSFNWISKLEGLNNLEQLQCLNLYNNIISKFEKGPKVGLKTLTRMKNISLAKNMLHSLQVIEQASSIQLLDISDNRIEKTAELVYLRHLMRLSELDMRENVIRYNVRYFDTCLNYCRNLSVLDGEEITAEVKVLSRKKFNTSIYEFVKTDTQHMILSNINFPYLTKSVIPYSDPPKPLIVLVGPPSCLKGLMVDLCCELFPQYIVRGINHTTRPRSEGEIDGEQYHFVTYETFKDMMRRGSFYTTSEYFGHLYGFAHAELTKVESKKVGLLLQSDINGALLLRARGLRPILVLTIPKSEEMHRKYLHRKYFCHSILDGIVEVGTSHTKIYEGLKRMKDYNHRHAVRAAKEMLVEVFKDVSAESDKSTIANPNINISGGMTFRNLFGGDRVSNSAGNYSSTKHDDEYWFVATDKEMHENLFCLQGLTERQKEILKNKGLREVIEKYILKKNEKTAGDEQEEKIPEEAEEFLKDNSNINVKETDRHQKLFDDIIASRQTYLEMHWANPGLFVHVVFTDHLDQALDTLTEVLKFSIRTYHLRSPICQTKYPPKQHPLVKKRIQRLRSMMSPKGIVANEKRNCPQELLGFQNVEGKSYSVEK